MDDDSLLPKLPDEVGLAIYFLIVWWVLIVLAMIAGIPQRVAGPIDDITAAAGVALCGALVHCIVERHGWARWALLALVTLGLGQAFVGESPSTDPLEAGAFAACLLIVALPAVAVCLLLTRRASRWFCR